LNQLWDMAATLARKAFVMLTGPKFVQPVLSVLLLCAVVELVTKRRWRRYLTRTFLTDLTYMLFFASGTYYFLFSGHVERFIKGLVNQHAPFLLVNALGFLPTVPKAIAMIMAIDFFEYWMHRAGHASKLYWNFHCIHHSPAQLTPLTKFRIHWGDMIVFGTVKAVPLLMLGHANVVWMPILPLGILQVLSHFDIDLHYGLVVGKLLVSPRYHRVHHSADPAQCNTNFGIIFSCWDYLFRTANDDLTRPAAFGCPQMQVPESFLQQFFYPFILVARSLGIGGARPQPAGDAAAH
jgi:sterol desaturase/sphingolipid hydroxylase (fatty acid hydroxylase superfamily)